MQHVIPIYAHTWRNHVDDVGGDEESLWYEAELDVNENQPVDLHGPHLVVHAVLPGHVVGVRAM